MTILEAKTIVFDFFTKNTVLDLSKDFGDLITISEDKEIDTAIILAALSEMGDAKLVQCLTVGADKKSIWVLNQPLQHYSQNVSLTFPTVIAILGALDIAVDKYKNKSLAPDPLKIEEKDIQNLLLMLQDELKNELKK